MICLKSLAQDMFARLYVLYALILERQENRSTRRKTLGAQERSTTGTPTHTKRDAPNLVELFRCRETQRANWHVY